MAEITEHLITGIDVDLYFAPSVRNMLSWRKGENSAKGKDHVRTILGEDVQISVPLVGGNSVLKQRYINWEKVAISSHGEWQRKHLGAWQAIYGKTPYFIHIFPELERIYKEHSYALFRDFCREINNIAVNYLNLDGLSSSANSMKNEYPMRFKNIQSEIESQISPELTIFDALFRLGPDVAYIFL